MSSATTVRNVIATALRDVNPAPVLPYLFVSGVGYIPLPTTNTTVFPMYAVADAVDSGSARAIDQSKVDIAVAPEWNRALLELATEKLANIACVGVPIRLELRKIS